MTKIQHSEASCNEDGKRNLLLSALRCAFLRAKLDANEFHTIGIALRSRMISPEGAMAWLVEDGLVSQVITGEPDDNKCRT